MRNTLAFLLYFLALSCTGCSVKVTSGSSSSSRQPEAKKSAAAPNALAETTGQKAEFEKKRSALEGLREKAVAERDDVVRKLRKAGVKQIAGLKGNLTAQRLAEPLAKLDQDIMELDHQIAKAGGAEQSADTLIRALEREKSSVSETEIRKLTEQLRERTNGTTKPLTPLQVQDAFERALKGDMSGVLQGKWRRKNDCWEAFTLEFTGTATVISKWNDEKRCFGEYDLLNNLLRVTRDGETNTYRLDFVADGEIILHPEKAGFGIYRFSDLGGRWKRFWPPSKAVLAARKCSETISNKTDFRKLIVGKWKVKSDRYQCFLQFDDAGNVAYKSPSRRLVGKYELNADCLVIVHDEGVHAYDLEFLDEQEFYLNPKQNWDGIYNFTGLEGVWRLMPAAR